MLLLTLACVTLSEDDYDARVDPDGDGSPYPLDCDNRNAAVFPGAVETCDGVDEDCDGEVDEGTGETWYEDEDGDGLGAEDETTLACSQPEGWVANATDCDDKDPDVGAATEWFADDDGDDYGDAADSVHACSPPEGYVADGSDCDDQDPDLNPETVWYADADGDGFGTESSSTACAPGEGWARQTGDCDDDDQAVNPDAEEVANDGVDNDCDGTWSRLEGGIVSVHARIDGPVGSEFGDSVFGLPDLDGDGVDELIVGAYGATTDYTGAGSAYLFYGPLQGNLDAEDDANWRLEGFQDEGVGSAVGGGVDLSGNGARDVVVSSVFAADIKGQVWLFQGSPTGGAGTNSAHWTLTGTSLGDGLGNAFVPGDFDGDQQQDLFIGANGALGNKGAAFLFLGPLSGQGHASDSVMAAVGPNSGSLFAETLLNAGDIDGDGIDDLLVGGPHVDGLQEDQGGAFLFLGGQEGLIASANADRRYVEESSDALAGWELASVGDLDGDGRPDFAVSAPGVSTNQGAVYVVTDHEGNAIKFLEDAPLILEGEGNNDGFGTGLLAEDMDGDGTMDLVVAAAGVNALRGRVYTFYGPLSGTVGAADADSTLTGQHIGDPIGVHLAASGDLAGDGRVGFVAAQPSANDNSGAVVIVLADGL